MGLDGIYYGYWRCQLFSNFPINTSSAIWWPNLQPIQVAPSGSDWNQFEMVVSIFFSLWYVDSLWWAYSNDFDLEVWWDPSFLVCGIHTYMWILYYGHIISNLIWRYGGNQVFWLVVCGYFIMGIFQRLWFGGMVGCNFLLFGMWILYHGHIILTLIYRYGGVQVFWFVVCGYFIMGIFQRLWFGGMVGCNFLLFGMWILYHGHIILTLIYRYGGVQVFWFVVCGYFIMGILC